MVDKVKPLKMEETGSGTELDLMPTETDPSEDYLSAAGLAFGNSDNYLMEQVGGVLKGTMPDHSFTIAYSGNNIDYIEAFNGDTKTTPNRIARWDPTIVSNKITSETMKYYDTADGTTVLRTITTTYTYTGNDVTGIEVDET